MIPRYARRRKRPHLVSRLYGIICTSLLSPSPFLFPFPLPHYSPTILPPQSLYSPPQRKPINHNRHQTNKIQTRAGTVHDAETPVEFLHRGRVRWGIVGAFVVAGFCHTVRTNSRISHMPQISGTRNGRWGGRGVRGIREGKGRGEGKGIVP